MGAYRVVVSLILCLGAWGCAAEGAAGGDGGAPVALLEQWTARVSITAHLVDRSKDYPPWLRVIDVAYDAKAGRARADIREGYEAGRTYIRRYDEKRDYMIKSGEFAECQRAYLGERMPVPQLPEGSVYAGTETIRGVQCEHWVDAAFDSRTHIYIEAARHIPIMVVDSMVHEDGSEEKIMSYEYDNIVLGPPDASVFELPEQYTHATCTRNVPGFPYLHVFHHYVRF